MLVSGISIAIPVIGCLRDQRSPLSESAIRSARRSSEPSADKMSILGQWRRRYPDAFCRNCSGVLLENVCVQFEFDGSQE